MSEGSKGSKGSSGLFHIDNKFADKEKWPSTLEENKQGKHMVGHKNYAPGKSVLTISMEKAAELVGYGVAANTLVLVKWLVMRQQVVGSELTSERLWATLWTQMVGSMRQLKAPYTTRFR